MLFSALVPIISFFAALFFYVKAHVDKYNLVFVYFKIFESGGKMRKHVISFMVFNLYFYMAVIVSFFSLKFQTEYFWGGGIMIITEIIIYFYIKKQLMSEFQLDEDLKTKMLENSLVAKQALKEFKKRQRQAMKEFKRVNGTKDERMASIQQDSEMKEFKKRLAQVIKFNNNALSRSYKHPFQHVN